jgi:superfamily II DNA/RNA helicase
MNDKRGRGRNISVVLAALFHFHFYEVSDGFMHNVARRPLMRRSEALPACRQQGLMLRSVPRSEKKRPLHSVALDSTPGTSDATLMEHSFEELFGETSSKSEENANGGTGVGDDIGTIKQETEEGEVEGERMLPSWLTERAETLGFRQPTLIQQRALEAILQERQDVILHAQTGSGKTLAYLLPLLSLIDPSRAAVQALVVVPTRELGLQVSKVARRLAAGYSGPNKKKIMVMSVLQGSQNKRQRAWAWSEPPQVVIGTPAELTKMVKFGGIRYNAVRYVVVDEVDACLAREDGGTGFYRVGDNTSPLHILLSRYLSPTFANDDDAAVEEESSLVATSAGALETKSRTVSHGTDRQTVFASATIPQHNHFRKQCVQNQWTVRPPNYIRASPGEVMPPQLSHEFVVCASIQSKLAGMRRLLKREAQRGTLQRALIFCDPERPIEEMAKAVAKDLEGIVWKQESDVESLKGKKSVVSVLRFEDSLSIRAAAMEAFRGDLEIENETKENESCPSSTNLIRVMFSTDLAARGLDVSGVSHVINFDLPDDGDKYVHRGGRAGRFGQRGTVVSLIISSQEFVLNRLANKLGLQGEIKCIARQKSKETTT